MEERRNQIRCYKCRKILLDNRRDIELNIDNCKTNCQTFLNKNFVHLIEDKLPEWIKSKIEQENWTKGKIHCESCHYRVGSFDFVSGKKCECGNNLLPSVHFIRKQVDIPVI